MAKTTRKVTTLALTTGALTAGLLLSLAGCALFGSEPTGADSAATTSTEQPAPGQSAPTTASTPRTDAASVAAVGAMTAYVQHHDDETAWWNGLSQYLSPEAKFVIEGTDPAQIPATRITGEAIATPASATSVSVLVPTDAGQYRLDMSTRGDEGEAGVWVVSGFTAPEGTR